VRRYALAHAILDIPNSRSSHELPTPRGGGLAIGVSALTAIAVCAWLGWVPARFAIGVLGGGVLIAAVGLLDDRRSLPAAARIAVHATAASWALFWLGRMSEIAILPGAWFMGWAGTVVALVGLVWLTNLYNFMDGIDGIAGAEAVSVGLIGGLLLLIGHQPGLATVAFTVAAASGGFLIWNWSPAKIFMGDGGAGLLGFLFGTLAIASEKAHAVPAMTWVLLLGVFVFDTTVTLARRVLRGDQWYRAHRSHAYQRAVQAGWSHRGVTTAVVAINVVLGFLGWVGRTRPHSLAWVYAIAALGLAVLYLLVGRLRPMARESAPPLTGA
jgi:Fuc2NAc and GlcNAc transferase